MTAVQLLEESVGTFSYKSICYAETLIIIHFIARICKRLRSPEIDSASLYVAWRVGMLTRVVGSARQAGNRRLCSLKGLQIWAQDFKLPRPEIPQVPLSQIKKT